MGGREVKVRSIGAWLVLAACAGGEGAVAPGRADVDDLAGWWVATAESDFDPTATYLGVVPGPDVERTLGLTGETADTSAIYTSAALFLPSLVQLATVEVGGGELRQTTLFDAVAGPGVTYTTTILGLTPGEELVLESADGTARTYQGYRACPSEAAHGFAAYATLSCITYFHTAAALAWDADGNLHHTAGNASPASDSLCNPPPMYGVLTPACGPVVYDAPEMLTSGLWTGDGEIVHTWSDLANDQWIRRRPLDSDSWEVVALGQAPFSPFRMSVFRDATGEVVVTGGQLSGISVRRASADWASVEPQGTSGPVPGPLLASAMAPTGHLGLLTPDTLWIAEPGSDTFSPVALPVTAGVGWEGGLRLLDADTAHLGVVEGNVGSNADGVGGRVLGGWGHVLVWDGGSFTDHPLGVTSAVLMPASAPGTDPVFAFTDGKAARPRMIVGRLDGGRLTASMASLGDAFAPQSSPEPFWKPAFAVGPNGEAAVTWNGDPMWVQRFAELPWRGRGVVTVDPGPARVRSDDGQIDCPGACEGTFPLGARVRLTVEADDLGALFGTCKTQELVRGLCWAEVTSETVAWSLQ